MDGSKAILDIRHGGSAGKAVSAAHGDAISAVEGFVALLQLLETHSAGDKADAVTFLEPKIVQSADNLRAAYEHAHKAVFARKADTTR